MASASCGQSPIIRVTRVVTVDVSDALHLKSAVLPIDGENVMVTPRSADESKLRGLRVLYEHDDERHRFSPPPLGGGSVLVTASAPTTTTAVASLDREIIPIDVSQTRRPTGA